ncbi:dephospho-CoA kinase [Arcanobacterium phocae]|uniref:dephospho-CoA kinase n=1 Tax=Arcanobacterium phocae TaxID=131112 RepID=UPI001C0F2926|nr:dephospho-CoA kinase [Arcanobacterium phocae]
MLKLAVTGGIASGKSTLTHVFATRGAMVIDADQVARDVVAPGTKALDQIGRTFGPRVLRADGHLDRGALASFVFSNSAARQQLESIIHPYIAREVSAQLRTAHPSQIVVYDVPLLVGSANQFSFMATMTIHTPDHVRIARMVDNRGMSPSQAKSRIHSQPGDMARAAISDIIVNNSSSEQDFISTATRLWDEWIIPYDWALSHERVSEPTGVMDNVSFRTDVHLQATRLRNAGCDVVEIQGTHLKLRANPGAATLLDAGWILTGSRQATTANPAEHYTLSW